MPTPASINQTFTLSRIQGSISRIYKSKFVRNVAVVASGTAGAQAITIGFAPVITRLYGPEAFGLLGTFMAIVAVVTPIGALSYPIAIVLPKEDADARGIARLSSYIAIGFATLVALVFLIAGDWIVNILQVQEISAFILLIPWVVVFAAWLQINEQWLIRKKRFKITARVAVLQAFIVNGIKSSIGLFKPVAAVLIILAALGSAIHAALLALGAKRAEEQDQQKSKTPQCTSLWKLAKKYYAFPIYRTPAGFVHGVTQSLPILMFAAFFGPAAAGFYALCRRLLGMPSQLISKSVGDVFYTRISEAAHVGGENLTRLILKATLALAIVGFVPFTLIVAYGPWVYGVVFGQEWMVAGEYARWLALMMFFNFINKPCVVTIPVLDLQLFQLLYEISSIMLKCSALVVGFLFFKSDLMAVALFSISGTILYMVLISYIILKSGLKN